MNNVVVSDESGDDGLNWCYLCVLTLRIQTGSPNPNDGSGVRFEFEYR